MAMLLTCLAAAPFLLASIPPLTDVPGHIGRFAVQTASAGDPVLRYFGFRWGLTLNLASDGIVQLLHPVAGVLLVTRALCALTPALTTLGLLSIARTLNPRGARALPWALLFVYNYPFLWGFLNYSLTAALALLLFPTWFALDGARRRRAVIFLVATPILLIGHGVAGLVGVGLIVSYALGDALSDRAGRTAGTVVRALLPLWPVVSAAIVTVAIWKLFGNADQGRTVWIGHRKTEAIWMMLRDQDVVFDVGSVASAALVWIAGRRSGARLGPGARGAVLFVILLFVATPSLISGSDRIDTRLAPLIPMVAFALQDWSAVASRWSRAVTAAGFVLLAIRLGVTAYSFVGYDQSYRRELGALDHVRRGARILNLSQVACDAVSWRSNRLEHLANLATPMRGAWVNAHWSIDGLQLLRIRYRPSARYDRDPSQLIWPSSCIDATVPFAQRERHSLTESIDRLPLDRVDYLWLVDARLPPGFRDPRLELVWSDGSSELYRTR
ncbi:MAG: hypothetical protein ACRYFW_02045 [Janthinobacterium lividum]